MLAGELDYLDMSLWDCFKPPLDPDASARSAADRAGSPSCRAATTRLGVAGKIMSAADARRGCWSTAPTSRSSAAARCCTTTIPRLAADPAFTPIARPVVPRSPARRGPGRGVHRLHGPVERLRRAGGLMARSRPAWGRNREPKGGVPGEEAGGGRGTARMVLDAAPDFPDPPCSRGPTRRRNAN